MNDEANMSIEAVRKALLEKEHEKISALLNERECIKLSDDEKLKRSKANLENNEFAKCKYLGNGAFEETLF